MALAVVPDRPRHLGRGSRGVLSLGIAAAVFEIVVSPWAYPNVFLGLVYSVSVLVSLSALVWSVLRGRPWGRPGWVLFTLVIVASLLGVIYRFVFQEGKLSAALDTLAVADYLFVVAYGMALLSLLYLINAVRRRREPLWIIDSAIVFVVMWAIGAVFIIAPLMSRGGAVLPILIQAFYLTVNAAILALGTRLLIATRPGENRGMRLALAGLMLFVADDLASTVAIINGHNGATWQGIYVGMNALSLALLGAGLVDPTIANAPARTPHEGRLSPWRSVLFPLAAVAALALVVSAPADLPAGFAALLVVLLALLVVARSWVLMQTYQDSVRLESALRSAGDAVNVVADGGDQAAVVAALNHGVERVLPGEQFVLTVDPEGGTPPMQGVAVPDGGYAYRAVAPAEGAVVAVDLNTGLLLDPREWSAVEDVVDGGAKALLRQRERLDREVVAEKARLAELLAGAQDMVVLLDPDGSIRTAAGAVVTLTGRSADWWSGRQIDELVADAEPIRRAAADPAANRVRLQAAVSMTGAQVEATVVRFGSGEVSVALHDVTERERMVGELAHQAGHDALTGLPNRVTLQRLLSIAEARWRDLRRPFCVIYIDVDDFKVINDSMGHRFGDALLVSLAGRLVELVADEGSVVRLGGDEFAVILEDCELAAGLAVAERVTVGVETPLEVEGVEIIVRASAGAAAAEQPEDTGDLLLQAADLALYDARARGKGGVAPFRADLRERAVQKLRDATAVSEAARRGDFSFEFQPVVVVDHADAGQRQATLALEALMRWDGGSLPGPDQFIPVAESLGELTAIMRQVVPGALERLVAWRRIDPDLRLAINVHAAAMLEEDFDGWIESVTTDADVPLSAMIIEISERTLVSAQAVRSLARLRAKGVSIWIDDFGTGWSNLSYLQDLPVTGLKLARELVLDDGGVVRRELVRAVVSLAEAMGFTVVAEGVEMQSQADDLAELGVLLMQGFLHARPMSSDDVPRWLAH